MAEYISRKEAIDRVCRLRIGLRADGFYKEDIIAAEIVTRIKAIPAAEVAPVRRGRWRTPVGKPDNYYVCDQCGWSIVGNKTNYCPNCGARMEVTE